MQSAAESHSLRPNSAIVLAPSAGKPTTVDSWTIMRLSGRREKSASPFHLLDNPDYVELEERVAACEKARMSVGLSTRRTELEFRKL